MVKQKYLTHMEDFFPLCWTVNHGQKNHTIYTCVPLLFFIYIADRHNLVEVSHRLQLL